MITLRSTAGEIYSSSGFFGSTAKNSSYCRSSINRITIYNDKSYAEGHYLTDTNCWDVTDAQDGSMIAWLNNGCVYMAPTVDNPKIMAHSNSNYMFANTCSLITGADLIDFSNTTSAKYFAYNTTIGDTFKYPSTLKVIDDAAFYNSMFSSFKIPDEVTNIGVRAFEKCKYLKEIEIPEGVTYIGDGAFSGCVNLTSVTLPSTIKYIGSEAFASCTKLESVVIPEGIEYVGSDAFVNTAWITDLKSNATDTLVIYNNILLDGSGASGDVIIPDEVKVIAGEAFDYNTKIKSVTLNESIVSLGNKAFSRCSSLASINLPQSLEYIGSEAFYACSSLTEIVIPKNVKYIGQYPIASSGITEVTFEDTEGWFVGKSAGSKEIDIESSELSTSALTYLKSTYYNYYWTKQK